MTKKYIVIIKHFDNNKEEIIGRRIFHGLTNVKANVNIMKDWNPEYEFEIFKIGNAIKL